MKLDHLTSTTRPLAHEALRPAHDGAEPKVRRVNEAERTSPDRNQSLPQQLTLGSTPEATTAAQKVRELAARLIRLGPQAKKLLKKALPGHHHPFDEKA